MKKNILTLALAAICIGAFTTDSFAGTNYVYGGLPSKNCPPSGCHFSYDYIDIAYMWSDYASNFPLGAATAPNGSLVDEMKGVNVDFRKSFGQRFYLAGEFYNTDGFLAPRVVRLAAQNGINLAGKRAEFYYYRLGIGAYHSISDTLDFTFDIGGLYADCQILLKDQDEWGWYLSPGLRYCLGNFGELYANYLYENLETMENHRFEGGLIVPFSKCMNVKLGGRYETEHDKTSILAGFRFNY